MDRTTTGLLQSYLNQIKCVLINLIASHFVYVSVHECLFCPQTFGSAIEKDDHTFEHFAQEVCSDCNRNLIRIGSNLYTLHSKETCFISEHPIGVKEEPFAGAEVSGEIEMQAEYSVDDNHSSNVKDVEFKIEPGYISDENESPMKIERDFVTFNDENTFPTSDKLSLNNLSAELNSVELPYNLDADLNEDNRKKGSKKRVNSLNTHCSICNLTLKTRKTYTQHMRHVHTLGKLHRCDCCGANFRYASELKVHTCRKEDDEQLRVIIDPKKHRMADGTYVCDVCNVSLKSRNALKFHKMFIHKELGEMACRRCKRAFKTAEGFADHQIECELKKQSKNFGDFKTFECDICRAVLKTKESIRAHIQHSHLKIEKRFKCDQCGFAFHSRSEVEKHHRSVHLNIRDFVCTTCGKAFKQRYELKNHEKFVHSGKTYKCPHENCNKHFSTPKTQKKHFETHGETREMPQESRVTCDLCGLSFANKFTLKNHQSTTHLNIRNFKCLICESTFKSKMALRLHTYIHTGEYSQHDHRTRHWGWGFTECTEKGSAHRRSSQRFNTQSAV